MRNNIVYELTTFKFPNFIYTCRVNIYLELLKISSLTIQTIRSNKTILSVSKTVFVTIKIK